MAIYNFLTQGEKTISELSKEFPAPSQAIKKLQEREIVEVTTEKFQRPASVEAVEGPQEKSFRFTKDQEKAFKKLSHSIDRSEFSTYLLHGVTGSGKTEIYLRCIQRALEQGKTAIMMVPEISLTPQTVTRFQNRFGNQVAILHSGLSQTERYQEWEKIRRGKVSIVVGARSAVFAPFKNPGVIVIDEEHDTSYKQDASPRYHARDTAIVRARAQNAVVILGSATPSMESLHNAKIDKYQYLSLGKRVQDRLLPVIRLVDMNQERKERKNYSILSGELRTAIRNRLERKEQTFLFLNRRGTAHYVNCRECAFVFDCPRCSVTLTFHGRENVLRCHYCGHQTRMSNTCKDCGGEVIRFSGFGTQKLEEETRRLFPEAKIIRLDRDTTRGKSSFETMHRLMNSREIDILIGTQMITKGHDFPHVTLVGVVQADLSLNIPDFRASERSFQLLTQVAGRAGRGKVPGQVIIQTSHPDHYVFDFVKKHDIEMFYQKEINFRKKLNYPPFTRMVAIEIEAENERQGESTTRQVKTILARLVSASPGSEILGPSRAALYQIKNKFRWHIILRSERAGFLQTIVSQFLAAQESSGLSNAKIKISLDVDPVNIM
jgi:primosomal protein N' (replication factor Y)